MDLIFDIATDALSRLLQERLSRERLVFDVRVPLGASTIVLDHLELGSLTLVPVMGAPTQVRLPGPGGTTEAVSVPGQSVGATVPVWVHLIDLAQLESLPPGHAPSTRRFRAVISFIMAAVPAGSGVRLVISSPAVDLSALPLDADQRSTLTDTVQPLLQDVTNRVASSLDLSALSALTGQPIAIRNAGLAVAGTTGTPSPFLQLAVELATAVPDFLLAVSRASAIAGWTAFYSAPTSRRTGAEWSLSVDGSLAAGGVARLLGSALDSAGTFLERSRPTGRWLAPEEGHPVPRVRVDAPITVLDACGTGHNVDVDVHADVVIGLEGTNTLRTDAHVSWTLDPWSELGCAFEVAFLGADGGFVIGGAVGGWIGAAIGAVIGFVVGFVGVLVSVAARAPSLTPPAGCVAGATPRDLVCRTPLALGHGDLFGGLAVTAVPSTAAGLVVAGTAGPSLGVPAAAEVRRVGGWTYRRDGGAATHSAVATLLVRNVGGRPLLIGPVAAVGAGHELWDGRIEVPSAAVPPTGTVTLSLVVPKADVDAARSAGTLQPPELLVFTTGGARVVRFADVPDEISDDALDRADALADALTRLRGSEYTRRRLLRRPLPDPGPEGDAAWVQATLPALAQQEQAVLAAADGQIFPVAVRRESDRAVLAGLVPAGTVPKLVLLRLDNGPTGEELGRQVAEALTQLDEASAHWSELVGYLHRFPAAEGATVAGVEVEEVVIDAGAVDLDVVARILADAQVPADGVAGVRFATTAGTQLLEFPLAGKTVGLAAGGAGLLHVAEDDRVTVLDLSSQLPILLGPAGAPSGKLSPTARVADRLAVTELGPEGAARLRVLAAGRRVETAW